MTNILTEIISLLTAGISQFATGFGKGLGDLVKSVFIDGTGDTAKLSTFGGLCIVFGAIALTIGLSRFVVNWLTSWGN